MANTLNTLITYGNTIHVHNRTSSKDSASSEVKIDCAVGQRISHHMAGVTTLNKLNSVIFYPLFISMFDFHLNNI
nr:hypothetical protein [uncultured Methanobacterium sp.]